MAQSYLLVDEYMRFIDKDGAKVSESILDVGVRRAMESIRWDEEAFLERGGIYDWTRDAKACSEVPKEGLDW
jgi:radical S-adenosyl methionine domain-containing protein 2